MDQYLPRNQRLNLYIPPDNVVGVNIPLEIDSTKHVDLKIVKILAASVVSPNATMITMTDDTIAGGGHYSDVNRANNSIVYAAIEEPDNIVKLLLSIIKSLPLEKEAQLLAEIKNFIETDIGHKLIKGQSTEGR